jgi:hypothetical protein
VARLGRLGTLERRATEPTDEQQPQPQRVAGEELRSLRGLRRNERLVVQRTDLLVLEGVGLTGEAQRGHRDDESESPSLWLCASVAAYPFQDAGICECPETG